MSTVFSKQHENGLFYEMLALTLSCYDFFIAWSKVSIFPTFFNLNVSKENAPEVVDSLYLDLKNTSKQLRTFLLFLFGTVKTWV